MSRSLPRAVAMAGLAWLAFGAASLEGQAFFVDAKVQQGYASDPLPSPFGFTVAIGRTSLVGPFGIHVGMRTLYEDGASDLEQTCGFAGCTPGPFEQSFSMRTFYGGLSYDFRNPVDVYLNLALNVGTTVQIESLVHRETRAETEDRSTSDTSLGGAIDLRLRPLIGPFRPAFSARFDRIFESACAADASCFPDRSVWGLSVGLSWVQPIR